MAGEQGVATDHHIVVGAEEINDFGGWTLDSQFEVEMGSPYLLAHGLGVPVRRQCVPAAENDLVDGALRCGRWTTAAQPGTVHPSVRRLQLGRQLPPRVSGALREADRCGVCPLL